MTEYEKCEAAIAELIERAAKVTVEQILAERTPEEVERIKVVLVNMFPESITRRTLH